MGDLRYLTGDVIKVKRFAKGQVFTDITIPDKEILPNMEFEIVSTSYTGYGNSFTIRHNNKQYKLYNSEIVRTGIAKPGKIKKHIIGSEKDTLKVPENKILRCPSTVLGCDPEVFIVDKKGELLPADRFLPSKDNGSTVFYDGIQAEINPVASFCRESLQSNIRGKLIQLIEKIEETDKTCKIEISPCMKIQKDRLDSANKDAKVFGCEPDFNGYNNGAKNCVNVKAEKHYIRYGGGHMHFGVNADSYVLQLVQEGADELVKLLDLFVSNIFVLIDKNENNETRRKLYGKAGDYRLPNHGIEYRTPSNVWLKHPALFSLAFGLGRLAIIYYVSGYYSEIMSSIDIKKLQEAINKNDYKLAKENYMKMRNLLNISENTFVREEAIGNYKLPVNIHNFSRFEKWLFEDTNIVEDLTKGKTLMNVWNIKKKLKGDTKFEDMKIGKLYCDRCPDGFFNFLVKKRFKND